MPNALIWSLSGTANQVINIYLWWGHFRNSWSIVPGSETTGRIQKVSGLQKWDRRMLHAVSRRKTV